MARISIETANKHLENNSREYKYVNNFYLKQRGENTFIRPLLADINDIEVYSIHNVRMTSKTHTIMWSVNIKDSMRPPTHALKN